MSPTPIIKDKRRTTKIKDIRSIYVIKWLFSQRQRTKDKKKSIKLIHKAFIQERRTKDKEQRTKDEEQRTKEGRNFLYS